MRDRKYNNKIINTQTTVTIFFSVIELEYCMTDGFVQVDQKQPLLHQSSSKQTSVIPRIIIDDLYTATKDKCESVHKEKRWDKAGFLFS